MNAPFSIDRPDVVHQAVCEVLTGIFPTIPAEALLSSDRINATTAWVRQAGMYLMAARLAVGHGETVPLRAGDEEEKVRGRVRRGFTGEWTQGLAKACAKLA